MLALTLSLGACATHQVERKSIKSDVLPCHVIYDAGSSRTRLYVYSLTATGWVRHRGPGTTALADPVRGLRGKTMSDASSVVDDIVTALDDIRRDGPVNQNGQPEWSAFDWQKQCRIDAAAVYATAGMRLAELDNPVASELLWKMLNDELSAALGMTVTTRTLTGFEEGLFAWMAIRDGQTDGHFGLVEMGGASVQIVFPCPQCNTSTHVRVKNQLVPIYSHSLLGWGQDEAWKKFGQIPACARGVGQKKPDWQAADCVVDRVIPTDVIADIKQRVSSGNAMRWYLSGAFQYMQHTDIDQFCRQGVDSGYQQLSSCFRAVYLPDVLNTLGIPAESKPSGLDWTLGAVICTASRCLSAFLR